MKTHSEKLFLIQSTDFFYPLVRNPHIMGAIACANVLSDIYAVGVSDVDSLQMIVGISTSMTEQERDVIVPMLIEGFKAQAKVAGVEISKVAVNLNPWMTIGGVVSSVCSAEEFIIPNQAKAGDVIILTKPLGTQMAVTIRSWPQNEEKLAFLKKIKVDVSSVKRCINSAITLMATINKKGAILMKKYKAHACTDITGYGLKGHAANLVKFQIEPVDFMIETLPILYPLGVIASHPGTRFYGNVNKGQGIETSGGLFICLPENHAKDVIREMNGHAWIIGRVTPGERRVVVPDTPDILHVTLSR